VTYSGIRSIARHKEQYDMQVQQAKQEARAASIAARRDLREQRDAACGKVTQLVQQILSKDADLFLAQAEVRAAEERNTLQFQRFATKRQRLEEQDAAASTRIEQLEQQHVQDSKTIDELLEQRAAHSTRIAVL
jgi:hypothetical protein